jgi:thiol-disulfide isomerase/thioredoxin
MKKLIMYMIFVLIIPFNSEAQGTPTEKVDSLVILDYPNSFVELLKGFEGRIVYIDIMASWCKPCIAELEHTKKLEDYFKENNIAKLFITIDQPKDVEKCTEILNRESINGYFTTYISKEGKFSQFAKEINNILIDQKGGIAIPKYFIVDKMGNLVVQNANRPSEPEELKKQLETYF